MHFHFIVALDKNNLIGKDGKLPWHLPADLAFFKKVTWGHPIIMGRKTYEAIGRTLPGRENIILTRDWNFKAEGCTIVHETTELLDRDGVGFVIGGAEVFKLFMPVADKLYITHIDAEFEGDTYFPEINQEDWTEVFREKGIKDEKNPYDYYFTIYERKTD